MSTYCEAAIGHEWHGPFHDQDHGFPVRGDAQLLERLVLEINQAGLSWLTILKKRKAFARAYEGFDPVVVARYGSRERERLMADAGIIRNRLKIEATIHNAGVIVAMRESHGGFYGWLLAHHPRDKSDWVRLFKQTFRFTGGEIVGEFLMGVGILPGAHHEGCPVYAKVLRTRPAWVDGKKTRSEK